MVDFNHVQHISFTQSRLTDAVSVILNGLLSYEHPPKPAGPFLFAAEISRQIRRRGSRQICVHFLLTFPSSLTKIMLC